MLKPTQKTNIKCEYTNSFIMKEKRIVYHFALYVTIASNEHSLLNKKDFMENEKAQHHSTQTRTHSHIRKQQNLS